MRGIAAIMACLFVTGCGLDVLTSTAITGELQRQNVERLSGTTDAVEQRTATWEVNQAIAAYRAEKGENPPSLEALVPEFLAEVPKGPDGGPLAYDPRTGQTGQGAGQHAGDYQTMNRIRQAINQYGHRTGYYPPSLDALAPHYLPEPPRTSDGRHFLYNPQTGAVQHPDGAMQQQRAPQPGQQRPGGGVSPMVDGMTGLGVQQELQGQRQSGAPSAGGYGRSAVERTQDQHNQRQQEALDALGF